MLPWMEDWFTVAVTVEAACSKRSLCNVPCTGAAWDERQVAGHTAASLCFSVVPTCQEASGAEDV